ncbi:hypothetical protein HNQ44_000239 [Planomicrobium koreense]|uniref:Uncharacterized protein n=1 Tax=Planococcus koreensis TaxID=112331 RepID=A0A7W8CRG7_9BACL|nr:hypothetical protein [Planococcus koreensis]MBB5178817.1 hypothetical protein [Planococcus koreensis]
MDMPKESELVALFEAQPKRSDELAEFYYDTSTFTAENERQSIMVVVSPFYNEFTLIVTEKEDQEAVSTIKLRSVEKMEIVEDMPASLRIVHAISESYYNTIEITLKPKFKMALHEHYQ